MKPERAEAIASALLSEALPRRWTHSQGVAAVARRICGALGGELLVASAWLHDIGYAPAIADSGYHPLDGARYLRDVIHAGADVCSMVAHHSMAVAGAAELGLAEVLADEFPAPPGELADALTYCDMTAGPDGESVSVEDRIAEICVRYGPDHPATRTMTRLAPDLTAAIARVEAGL